jgi:hypothetical protein
MRLKTPNKNPPPSLLQRMASGVVDQIRIKPRKAAGTGIVVPYKIKKPQFFGLRPFRKTMNGYFLKHVYSSGAQKSQTYDRRVRSQ